MTRSVVSVRRTDTVATARHLLREHQIHHLLVVDGTSVEGVVAMRDLAGKPEETPVASLMLTGVGTIDAGESLRRAASMMVRATTGCLPVIENGQLAGVITTSDLMRVLNADMTLS